MPLDLDVALRKANAGSRRVQRQELEWLIRDLVAELRAAREVIRQAAIGHGYGRMTTEFVQALRAYQELFGEVDR